MYLNHTTRGRRSSVWLQLPARLLFLVQVFCVRKSSCSSFSETVSLCHLAAAAAALHHFLFHFRLQRKTPLHSSHFIARSRLNKRRLLGPTGVRWSSRPGYLACWSWPRFFPRQFFKTKVKMEEENLYTGLRGQETDGGYAPLMTDPERGRNRRAQAEDPYTGLQKRSEGTYKELPVKRDGRANKKEQIYQGLSSATRDTYDSLQMQQR
ncbi:T-cell surface glycoprotein CD3 zeta chain [Kryptolebias marmoratus]|uniref:T-cell surface glycoprotein CD3 zeta chain n=1 Tax=Kryptolebias marmoratus TaxID=37003 RepID=UPI0018ACC12B|nr:T-cell surface glycoprotein CD3 zeta chain [Kryptolebias marmoratus]